MSLENGFKTIIRLQGRSVTLQNKDETKSVTKVFAYSNYFRNFQGFEETIFEGYEWVTDADGLSDFGNIQRGDTIIDSELGNMTIEAVRPMMILGKIAGYRVRTN